jgi:hypothetical protein
MKTPTISGFIWSSSRDVANVEAVEIVKELHTSWGIFARRSCDRVDKNRRLLPLKLVNSAHLRPGQTLYDPKLAQLTARKEELKEPNRA